MAFMKNINDLRGILTLMVLTLPSIAANIDCNGKPFHCVNSTHFMICVDLGSGVSSTIDDFVIPCPPTTVCQGNNRFECEFPPVISTIAPSVVPISASEPVGIVTVTTPLYDMTTSIPFEEYFNTVGVTTLSEDTITHQTSVTEPTIQLVTDDTQTIEVIIPEPGPETNSTVSENIIVVNVVPDVLSTQTPLPDSVDTSTVGLISDTTEYNSAIMHGSNFTFGETNIDVTVVQNQITAITTLSNNSNVSDLIADTEQINVLIPGSETNLIGIALNISNNAKHLIPDATEYENVIGSESQASTTLSDTIQGATDISANATDMIPNTTESINVIEFESQTSPILSDTLQRTTDINANTIDIIMIPNTTENVNVIEFEPQESTILSDTMQRATDISANTTLTPNTTENVNVIEFEPQPNTTLSVTMQSVTDISANTTDIIPNTTENVDNMGFATKAIETLSDTMQRVTDISANTTDIFPNATENVNVMGFTPEANATLSDTMRRATDINANATDMIPNTTENINIMGSETEAIETLSDTMQRATDLNANATNMIPNATETVNVMGFTPEANATLSKTMQRVTDISANTADIIPKMTENVNNMGFATKANATLNDTMQRATDINANVTDMIPNTTENVNIIEFESQESTKLSDTMQRATDINANAAEHMIPNPTENVNFMVSESQGSTILTATLQKASDISANGTDMIPNTTENENVIEFDPQPNTTLSDTMQRVNYISANTTDIIPNTTENVNNMGFATKANATLSDTMQGVTDISANTTDMIPNSTVNVMGFALEASKNFSDTLLGAPDISVDVTYRIPNTTENINIMVSATEAIATLSDTMQRDSDMNANAMGMIPNTTENVYVLGSEPRASTTLSDTMQGPTDINVNATDMTPNTTENVNIIVSEPETNATLSDTIPVTTENANVFGTEPRANTALNYTIQEVTVISVNTTDLTKDTTENVNVVVSKSKTNATLSTNQRATDISANVSVLITDTENVNVIVSTEANTTLSDNIQRATVARANATYLIPDASKFENIQANASLTDTIQIATNIVHNDLAPIDILNMTSDDIDTVIGSIFLKVPETTSSVVQNQIIKIDVPNNTALPGMIEDIVTEPTVNVINVIISESNTTVDENIVNTVLDIVQNNFTTVSTLNRTASLDNVGKVTEPTITFMTNITNVIKQVSNSTLSKSFLSTAAFAQNDLPSNSSLPTDLLSDTTMSSIPAAIDITENKLTTFEILSTELPRTYNNSSTTESISINLTDTDGVQYHVETTSFNSTITALPNNTDVETESIISHPNVVTQLNSPSTTVIPNKIEPEIPDNRNTFSFVETTINYTLGTTVSTPTTAIESITHSNAYNVDTENIEKYILINSTNDNPLHTEMVLSTSTIENTVSTPTFVVTTNDHASTSSTASAIHESVTNSLEISRTRNLNTESISSLRNNELNIQKETFENKTNDKIQNVMQNSEGSDISELSASHIVNVSGTHLPIDAPTLKLAPINERINPHKSQRERINPEYSIETDVHSASASVNDIIVKPVFDNNNILFTTTNSPIDSSTSPHIDTIPLLTHTKTIEQVNEVVNTEQTIIANTETNQVFNSGSSSVVLTSNISTTESAVPRDILLNQNNTKFVKPAVYKEGVNNTNDNWILTLTTMNSLLADNVQSEIQSVPDIIPDMTTDAPDNGDQGLNTKSLKIAQRETSDTIPTELSTSINQTGYSVLNSTKIKAENISTNNLAVENSTTRVTEQYYSANDIDFAATTSVVNVSRENIFSKEGIDIQALTESNPLINMLINYTSELEQRPYLESKSPQEKTAKPIANATSENFSRPIRGDNYVPIVGLMLPESYTEFKTEVNPQTLQSSEKLSNGTVYSVQTNMLSTSPEPVVYKDINQVNFSLNMEKLNSSNTGQSSFENIEREATYKQNKTTDIKITIPSQQKQQIANSDTLEPKPITLPAITASINNLNSISAHDHDMPKNINEKTQQSANKPMAEYTENVIKDYVMVLKQATKAETKIPHIGNKSEVTKSSDTLNTESINELWRATVVTAPYIQTTSQIFTKKPILEETSSKTLTELPETNTLTTQTVISSNVNKVLLKHNMQNNNVPQKIINENLMKDVKSTPYPTLEPESTVRETSETPVQTIKQDLNIIIPSLQTPVYLSKNKKIVSITDQVLQSNYLNPNHDTNLFTVDVVNTNFPVLIENVPTLTHSGFSVITKTTEEINVDRSVKNIDTLEGKKSRDKEDTSEAPDTKRDIPNMITQMIYTTMPPFANSQKSKSSIGLANEQNVDIDQSGTLEAMDSRSISTNKILLKTTTETTTLKEYTIDSHTQSTIKLAENMMVHLSPEPVESITTDEPLIFAQIASADTNIKNSTASSTRLTKSQLANTHNETSESATKSRNFVCKLNTRGRFSDNKDCRKFYICIGKHEPIEGLCPNNTVFSELRKQCTKNLSHCVRNNQFQCISEGRFSDYLTDDIYYICVKNNVGTFIRFTLQCESDYSLNKTSVHCDLNTDSSQSTSQQSTGDISKNNSDQSVSSTKSDKLTIESSEKFKCKKEGTFPEANDCRKYYICEKKEKSLYRKRTRECDSDELFDKDKKKCVESDSYDCS